ncbi:MAG TPA: DUF1565 domain-containing protein, partial [Lacibacter sp.]|nr:DUF1565 domain-containing protein [Lacibacter sp.]
MNRITSAIRLFFLFAILLIGKQANSQTINNWGVVGSATPNGWGGPDIPLSYNAGLNTWSAVVTLINGEIKFRNNNDWALNYGDNGADGTLDAGGSNIVVAAGTYLITLDFTTLNYSISQTKAYYVNDNFPAGDLFTSAVGNDINTGTKAAPFATITYALSQAAAGDTIYVDAGTYVEQVTIYKGVVIKGAGQNLTSILKPAVTNDPPAVPPSTFAERGVIQTAQSILGDVHISDLSVTGDYTLNVTPIIIQSGGSVRNCTLQSGNQGIFVRIDPAIIPVAKTFVVDGNTINAEYIAVNFAGSSRLTATLSNNTLATFNPGFSTGVFAGTDFGTLTRLTVTGNIFSSYVTDGLFVNTNNGIISQNSFLGTGAKAINKFGGSTINATCNWYGSADVNVLALKITPGVTFSPWLVNGTDNSAAIGFQPVPNTCTGKQTRYYVFNNTSGTRLFTTGVGNDANPGIASSPMATITGAYQKAQTGDTIIVDAGTYDLGGLTYTFPKSVTFLGTNYLVSPNDAADKLQPNTSRNAESIINNFTFLITSNDLSFEGFTIDPGNRTLLSLSNAAFGRLKFRRNHVRISSSVSVFNLSGVVATDPALLTSSDYLFDDNRFNRSASGSGITFSLNYLKNVVLSNNSGVISGPTTRAQIFAAVGQSGVVDSLSLTGNVIDRANYNLFTSLASRLYVTGNKFYNAARGLFIQTTVSGSSEVLVENNEIVHNLPGTVINSIISCNRFNGNSAATNVARIRNNNITIDATGLSFVPSAISGFNAGTLVNPVLEISGNKITHSGNFSSLTSIFNAISVTGNLLNASITANELVNSGTNYLLTPINSSASTSSGIQMSTDAGINSVTAAAVININNNKVSGYKQSVIFYDFSTTAPNTYTGYGNLPAGVTVNINNNSFANDSISINNGTVGQPVLATCNWYGSADAAVVVPKLSANVNYSPWLSNGTDNDVATGFQPVPNSCNGRQNKFYVNDADITGDVFTTKIGDDANSGIPSAPLLTINAAITKASAGDTIFVDAGTYNLASPLTINKSITILGSNYLVSPNDATTKTIYNSSRNAEARITGAALVIGADYINLKGLRFSPTSGAVSQNGNFSHIKIEKNYFDVIGTGNIINLQGSTSNPIVAFDFAITDNRFERTDLLTGRSINLGLVKNVWIDNNLFIETPASGNPYRGFALRTESNQRVESTVFSNNYVKKLQVGVLPTMIQDWTINNNVFDSCTTGINHIPANMVSTNVFIRSNTFTNMRVGRSILVRGGTNGGVSNYNITDNTHNQEVDGINGIVGMIQLDFNAPNTFGTVSVMRNKLNLGGNYQNTVIETNCGIFLVGEHTNTTIADNELSFSAINARTHTFGVMPPVPTGVFINTDNLTSSSGVTGPVITISNNKIHGFKSSIGLYDPTATGATPSIGYGYLNNAATVTIINNSFTGDSMSIDNGTTSKFVLSTCNWYGSAAAQDFISKLSLATVEVIPWLTNGTDNDAATGFQPVSGSCDGYPTLITLNSSTNVTCNGAANGSIAITTSYGKAPFTYTWTKEGDANFVSHDEDPTGLAPGTYTLSILDGNGSNIYITDPEADGPGVITVVITEPDVLTASATGSNNICFNGAIGSASVTASGGTAPYTYLWSNGATTEEISNLTAGVYIVTVTDDHGCTATASYEVTQPTLLTASINNSSTACSNIATVT